MGASAIGVALTLFVRPAAADDRFDTELGRAVFERAWVFAPASAAATDGLGPLYNARSCASCHGVARRTVAEGAPDVTAIAFKFAPAPDPVYGVQLQTAALPGLAAEGRVRIVYGEVSSVLHDGTVVSLRRPRYEAVDLAYGPLGSSTRLSPRVPPALSGIGLIEQIAAADILAGADAADVDGDGISGRPSLPAGCQDPQICLGRFGWKAEAATIATQNAMAFQQDIGMSTPLRPFPWGDCTEKQPGCRAAVHGDAAAEIAPVLADLLEKFVRALPAPSSASAPPDGAALFGRLGCDRCHRPRFDTPAGAVVPYSDLLLHDMGPDLRDAPGDAGDWRTAPLWGIGALDRRPGDKAYLHDGRARTLDEAILWHGGEAAAAAAAFRGLTAPDRAALVAFLRSL